MPRTLLSVLLLLSCAAALAEPPELTIEISGVSGEILANVQSNLRLNLQRDHPLLSESLIRRLHATAVPEIRRALEPFGYYRPLIDATLTDDAGRWTARYAITPGDPLRIAQVRLTFAGPGADDAAFNRWRATYPLAPGDILSHRSYESARNRLRQLGRERGYMEGRLETHRILVDLTAYEATIELHYDTGPRYAFGAISLVQEDFAEDFLRRFITFESGDPFDATQLLVLRRSLADSDYFERADVLPLYDEIADLLIPVRITLIPRKRKLYTVGLGYSTDTGARGRLGFEERRANRHGHRYGATLRQSEIQSGFTARYQVPLKRPVTDALTYTVRWLDEETDTTDRTTASVGADITQQMGSWLRTTGLSYEWERFVIDVEEQSLLLIPHVRWQRVKADQRIQTRRGWIFTIGVRGASENIVSDTSFLQLRSSGKYIHGITERSRLLLRANGGLSWTPEFSELPTSQRFFAGGDESVRGYAYNSLGPEDDSGRVVGGRHIAVGSIEYEFDILQRTALAVFYDAGNAYNGNDIEARVGAGVGIRWRTPIGAIRIDVAQALSKPDRPWRLHLTLGPDL